MSKIDIILSEEELQEFNHAVQWADQTFTKNKAIEFLQSNPDIYWEGKKWGFNDTVVREDILKCLKD